MFSLNLLPSFIRDPSRASQRPNSLLSFPLKDPCNRSFFCSRFLSFMYLRHPCLSPPQYCCSFQSSLSESPFCSSFLAISSTLNDLVLAFSFFRKILRSGFVSCLVTSSLTSLTFDRNLIICCGLWGFHSLHSL